MKRNRSVILEALRVAAVDEDKAVAFLEEQRWGNEPRCPRCSGLEGFRLKPQNDKLERLLLPRVDVGCFDTAATVLAVESRAASRGCRMTSR